MGVLEAEGRGGGRAADGIGRLVFNAWRLGGDGLGPEGGKGGCKREKAMSNVNNNILRYLCCIKSSIFIVYSL